ncbi:hypothetical protein Bca52824_032201 [Brassica carinata]|uniref:LIM zinc-binding domain-containing protein n=1 Tax=Brassica carinata TaxID=52824 RepID=A0A8X7SDQ1_BRACI|nr:hypothetical protein Bca52824_032201 [Brassica carinata]
MQIARFCSGVKCAREREQKEHILVKDPFHKSCFKCSHCKSTLQVSNYSSMEGVLYYNDLIKSASIKRSAAAATAAAAVEAVPES